MIINLFKWCTYMNGLDNWFRKMNFEELQFSLFWTWILQTTQAEKKCWIHFLKSIFQGSTISAQLHKRSFVISVFWRIKYFPLCQKQHWSIYFSKVCYSNLLRGHSITTLARRGVWVEGSIESPWRVTWQRIDH